MKMLVTDDDDVVVDYEHEPIVGFVQIQWHNFSFTVFFVAIYQLPIRRWPQRYCWNDDSDRYIRIRWWCEDEMMEIHNYDLDVFSIESMNLWWGINTVEDHMARYKCREDDHDAGYNADTLMMSPISYVLPCMSLREGVRKSRKIENRLEDMTSLIIS